MLLQNLVINAFDAMAAVIDRPRTVILRTRPSHDARVQVDVADSGPGIAAADDRRASVARTAQHGVIRMRWRAVQ